MRNFNFLEKGLRKVSPPHFVYDFSGKMFLMLYSNTWSYFIALLSLLFEILVNMSCNYLLTSCEVINFEINLTFLIKPLFDITKTS